jgi:hypothetical protein
MIRTKLFPGCALAFIVSLAIGTTAIAQEPVDQRTYFTFSAPFELPGGKTLPAGRYTFRIVDSPSNRHVVQILSEDGKQMHATIMAIPAQRQDPPNDPEVRFMETAANQPPAIRTWWYPGRTIGHEFIYPKDQARRLAKNQRESVLTVSGDQSTPEAMETADLTRISSTGEETRVTAEGRRSDAEQTRSTGSAAAPAERSRTAEATQRTEPAPRTTAAEPDAPRTAPARRATDVDQPRTELPRTASVMPLVGLVGLASLVGAAAVRMRRR